MSRDLVPFLHARLDEEAKRRVLARHVPWDNRDDCRYDGETWPCDDLLDLASPYAGHPDYSRDTPEPVRRAARPRARRRAKR